MEQANRIASIAYQHPHPTGFDGNISGWPLLPQVYSHTTHGGGYQGAQPSTGLQNQYLGSALVQFPFGGNRQSDVVLAPGQVGSPRIDDSYESASTIPEPQQGFAYGSTSQVEPIEEPWQFGVQFSRVEQAPGTLVGSDDFTHEDGWPLIPFFLGENHVPAIVPFQQQVQGSFVHGFHEDVFAVLDQPPVFEPQLDIVYDGINYHELLEEPAQFRQQVVYADPIPEAPMGIEEVARGGDGSNLPQASRCKYNCGGNFNGQHECLNRGRALTIRCLGSNNCSSTFKNRNDFNRHCNTTHLHTRAGGRQLIDCPFPGCERVGERGFKRKDNLTQHRRLVHDQDIPKRAVRFNRTNARIHHRDGAGAAGQGEVGQQ